MALLVCTLLAGCQPDTPRVLENQRFEAKAQTGQYLYSSNKLFETDSKLDIRSTVMYPSEGDTFDPSLNLSNRELTFQRCKTCHDECGFDAGFDKEHYGTEQWNPRIKGQDWAPVVERMRMKENAFLNEVIAERVYNYLRDETTGKYNEAADTKGAIVVELPEGVKAPPEQQPPSQ